MFNYVFWFLTYLKYISNNCEEWGFGWKVNQGRRGGRYFSFFFRLKMTSFYRKWTNEHAGTNAKIACSTRDQFRAARNK